MRLLVVTQVIDINHPILGFFHGWVDELAKYCEEVQVICLQAGKHNLPANVKVYSLGKDEGKGRLTYLFRFFKLIWSLKKDYDHVFVHMNQIYVILGAPIWRLLHKKVGLWYAHGTVSLSLKLATFFTNTVFTSTAEGFCIDTPKRVIVGQGIDPTLFVAKERVPSSVLKLVTVGRIAGSKNIDNLLRACRKLKEKQVPFLFTIVGTALTKDEQQTETELRQLAFALDLQNEVVWAGAISNQALPAELNKADIFIHDGATDSLDKALLEAALCGCIVVSSNKAYQALTVDLAPKLLYRQGDFAALSAIITEHKTSLVAAAEVRKMIAERYTINTLVKNIINAY
ncbi:MAG: glycosyltransferase [Patescibacteria group bacterium]